MKVSVIVPVYNGAEYLKERVGNLLNQTIDSYEVIFVDDASTDQTLMVLEAAKEQFPDRVRVFSHKENKGPGAAKNIGLAAAQGDYIGFCDADDVVDVTMYEKLYDRALSSDADIVDCAFFRESEDKALRHFTQDIVGEISNKQKSDILIGGYAVTKLFRRDLFFTEPPILFREEYALEDMDFLMRLIARAGRFDSVEDVLYVYKDSGDSLSKERDFFKYYRCNVSAMAAVYESMSALPGYNELQDAVEICLAALYTNVMPTFEMAAGRVDETVIREMRDTLIHLRKATIKKNIADNPYFETSLRDEAKQWIRNEKA